MIDVRPAILTGIPPAVAGSLALHVGALAGLAAEWTNLPWALAAIAANHAVLMAACVSARSDLLGPNITRLPEPARIRGEVAVTFDDGPDPVGTPLVLDILDRFGATASFFCIGDRAARDPGLVREIVARGHSVENHTFRHPNTFAFRLPPGLAVEIGRAQDLLTGLTGRVPGFFRAPMGIRGPWLQLVLERLGLSLVSWTRRGFDGVPASPDAVVARSRRGLAAGDILVLHDGGPLGGHVAVAALPRLLGAISDHGLRAVSLTHAFAPATATTGAGNPV